MTVYCGQPNYYHPSTPNRPRSFVDDVSAAFASDPLTPSLWAAAAASAAFANTTADVKFSLDGLTAMQAIQLMQGVRAANDQVVPSTENGVRVVRPRKHLNVQGSRAWRQKQQRERESDKYGLQSYSDILTLTVAARTRSACSSA